MPGRPEMHRALQCSILCGIVALALITPAAGLAEVRARCNTAFDAEFFYIVADVDKPVLRGKVSAPFQDPTSDDSVLVGLASAQDPARRVEMAVGVANGAQLYRGADRRALSGPDDFVVGPDGMRTLFKYRLRPRGKLNAESDPDNGFTVEMAIPWAELGGPPKPGDRMRFLVAILGAGEEDAPIVSLSASITQRDDIRDLSRWGEIVFADAPTASVSGSPNAVVCARVYNVKPVIDGAFDAAEWSRITAFAFGAGVERSGTLPGDAAAARSRAPVELKQAPPLPSDGKWSLGCRAGGTDGDGPEKRRLARQMWPRLVFARYLVDRQADARKPLPFVPVAEPTGKSLLVTHPMDGAGPWFTYDRIDWHRIQLTRMRESGVDVAAVVMPVGRQGRIAVTALAGAMEALEGMGADLPLACLWLDVSSLTRAGDSPSERTDRVYRAVREFHQCLPTRFVAAVSLASENGGGVAVPVIVSGVPGDAGTPRLQEELRRRFRQEFGRDLLLLGDQPGGWDGVVADSSGEGYAAGGEHPVRTASIYAGTPGLAEGEHPLFRRSRDGYRSAWRSAITDAADWVFVDSWNDFARASEIAPTVEYGLEYLDMTQAFSRLWRRSGELGGHVVRTTMPDRWVHGRAYAVRVTVRNTGTLSWLPGSFAIRAAWQGGRGSALATLQNPIDMGRLCTVSLRLPSPDGTGLQTLVVSVVKVDRSGAPLPGANSAAVLGSHTVVCTEADSPAVSPATLVNDTVLRVAEGLSVHRATVVVRNDGPTAWEAGQATLRARLFEQTPDDPEPKALDLAEAASPVSERVEPGSEATFDIAIPFATHEGLPFRPSEHTESRYLIRWDLDAPGADLSTVALGCQEVQIVEADFGAQFFNDYTPNELPGDRRVSVVIGVRNRGPQTWVKGKVAVGYHWYYLDGVEAVWQDEVFPINADMAPGSQIADVGAWVTAPPNDGMYWLVWDLRVGDTWASAQLSARAYETRVQLVKVVRGRLRFVDLSPAANATITAGVGDPPVQGFDGSGMALPAELTPPYATGTAVCTGLWQAATRTGPDLNRRISFQWLPRGRANGVRC